MIGNDQLVADFRELLLLQLEVCPREGVGHQPALGEGQMKSRALRDEGPDGGGRVSGTAAVEKHRQPQDQAEAQGALVSIAGKLLEDLEAQLAAMTADDGRQKLLIVEAEAGHVRDRNEVCPVLVISGVGDRQADFVELRGPTEQLLVIGVVELPDVPNLLEETYEVLEAHSLALPPDHPELVSAKGNLGLAKAILGDLEGARALGEAVLGAFARLFPPEHPQVLRAKEHLAYTKGALGDLEGARVLKEDVLAARARLLPPDHWDVLRSKAAIHTPFCMQYAPCVQRAFL